MKLADEIPRRAILRRSPEGVLAGESRVVANSKKMFLQAAGGAVQKFREKLADEQELIGALSKRGLWKSTRWSPACCARKKLPRRGRIRKPDHDRCGARVHQ